MDKMEISSILNILTVESLSELKYRILSNLVFIKFEELIAVIDISIINIETYISKIFKLKIIDYLKDRVVSGRLFYEYIRGKISVKKLVQRLSKNHLIWEPESVIYFNVFNPYKKKKVYSLKTLTILKLVNYIELRDCLLKDFYLAKNNVYSLYETSINIYKYLITKSSVINYLYNNIQLHYQTIFPGWYYNCKAGGGFKTISMSKSNETELLMHTKRNISVYNLIDNLNEDVITHEITLQILSNLYIIIYKRCYSVIDLTYVNKHEYINNVFKKDLYYYKYKAALTNSELLSIYDFIDNNTPGIIFTRRLIKHTTVVKLPEAKYLRLRRMAVINLYLVRTDTTILIKASDIYNYLLSSDKIVQYLSTKVSESAEWLILYKRLGYVKSDFPNAIRDLKTYVNIYKINVSNYV